MVHPYTVALEDAPELPSSHRITAEARFAAVIESRLGGPEAVATAYRAWVCTNDSEARDVDQDTASLAVLWPRAFETARQAGLREVGELPSAHFEVRLERQRHAGS